MFNYVILMRDNTKNEYFCKEVSGYNLTPDFVAHKDREKKEWIISDLASGMKVIGGFKTFSDAKAALLTQPEVFAKAREMRKHPRYQELLKIKKELYNKMYAIK